MAIADAALLSQPDLMADHATLQVIALPILVFALLPLVGGLLLPRHRRNFTWMSWSVAVASSMPFWSGAPQSLAASIVLLLTAMVASGPTSRIPRRRDDAKILLDPSSPATITMAAVAMGCAVATTWIECTSSQGVGMAAAASLVPPSLLLLLASSRRRYGALMGLLSSASFAAFAVATRLPSLPRALELASLVATCALLRSGELRDRARHRYPVRYAGLDRITLITFCLGLASATTVVSARAAHAGATSQTVLALLASVAAAACIPALRTARRLRSILLVGLACQLSLTAVALDASRTELLALAGPLVLAAAFHSNALRRATTTAPRMRTTVAAGPRLPQDRRPITEIPLARGA